MSIPKKPRQLMINIMYLVLTAMLALNVSAEVMNAFFDIDHSLEKSGSIAENAFNETKEGLQAILEKKPKLKEPINNGLDITKSNVDAFVNRIENLKQNLIDAAGNNDGSVDDLDYDKDGMENGKPRGKKDKDATTRILVKGESGKVGEAHLLEGEITELRERIIDTYSDVLKDENVKLEQGFDLDTSLITQKMDAIENSITLKVTDDWKKSDKKSWADYKFFQMPLAATLPILTKIQTDARNAQATISGKMAELAGGKEIKFDKFFPVLNAKKGYVIKGERFDADISLGAYSSEVKGVEITVNGRRIALDASGVGKFSETANQYGKRTLNLNARVTNPITGRVENGTATFEYEVGERSATVSATKMNVFYMGVDNPIEVAVAGASSNEVNVSCSGGGCNLKGGNGKYVATVNRQGVANINVSAKGFNKTFEYRVKRIPDPIAKLGGEQGGAIGNGTFIAQQGVIAALEGFDFDAKCLIQGFTLVRVPRKQDAIQVLNAGGRFKSESQNLTGQARPGDIYYFENVKAKCPGDQAARRINDLVFRIK